MIVAGETLFCSPWPPRQPEEAVLQRTAKPAVWAALPCVFTKIAPALLPPLLDADPAVTTLRGKPSDVSTISTLTCATRVRLTPRTVADARTQMLLSLL